MNYWSIVQKSSKQGFFAWCILWYILSVDWTRFETHIIILANIIFLWDIDSKSNFGILGAHVSWRSVKTETWIFLHQQTFKIFRESVPIRQILIMYTGKNCILCDKFWNSFYHWWVFIDSYGLELHWLSEISINSIS